MDELKQGENYYVARVRLMLNYGKLIVEPGAKVILGPDDKKTGINIGRLIETGAIAPCEFREQATIVKGRKPKRRNEKWLD